MNKNQVYALLQDAGACSAALRWLSQNMYDHTLKWCWINHPDNSGWSTWLIDFLELISSHSLPEPIIRHHHRASDYSHEHAERTEKIEEDWRYQVKLDPTRISASIDHKKMLTEESYRTYDRAVDASWLVAMQELWPDVEAALKLRLSYRHGMVVIATQDITWGMLIPGNKGVQTERVVVAKGTQGVIVQHYDKGYNGWVSVHWSNGHPLIYNYRYATDWFKKVKA